MHPARAVYHFCWMTVWLSLRGKWWARMLFPAEVVERWCR